MSLHDTHPFLCRSPLLPGESLASLLVRLSLLNAYPSPAMVTSVGKARLPAKDVLTQPRYAETYHVLAGLTRLAPATLYQATAHAFAGLLTSPGEAFPTVEMGDGEVVPLLSPVVLQHHIRPAERASYCPRCLQEGRYHRLTWMLCAANVCLAHRCLLVGACQTCQALLRVVDIVKGRCPQCQFDLTAATAVDVSGDEFGLFAQTTLLSWFGLAPERSGTNGSQWSASLPQQTGPILYRLVTGIQRSLLGIDPDWPYLHKATSELSSSSSSVSGRSRLQSLTPEIAHLLLATAFKAMVNWPHGFYDFLDAFQGRNGRTVTHAFTRDFGKLYHLCLARRWASPHFQFVQEAFDHYLVESYPLAAPLFSSQRYRSTPHLANRLPCMTADEAAERLQTTTRTLNRLVARGFLVNYRGKIARKAIQRAPFICRPEVLALQQRWSSGLPQEDVACLLGLTIPILADLVDAGMLTTICMPNTEDAGPTFTSKPVMSLLDRLMYGTVSKGALQPDTGFLSEMAATLARFGYRPASVMHLARKHLIRFGWEKQPGPYFGAFWVSTEDLDFQLDLLPEERPYLSRLQAARRLQVPVAILMEWSLHGFLSFVREPGAGWQFARAELDRFTAQYARLEETARLLGVSNYTLRQWMKKGRLFPICGPSVDGCQRPLFHRTDVKRLLLSRH
jgi:hypothetical protein